MKKIDTRSAIIRIGTDLISRQGFNATGIDSVLKEADFFTSNYKRPV